MTEYMPDPKNNPNDGTWFDGIDKCPYCCKTLPSMRANDGWWGCEECGFEIESAEEFQKRTGFQPRGDK